jgi:hypothetical protein
MLIEKFDVSVVDTLRNLFPDLMRRSPLDHVQTCPSVLGLGTRRRTDEKVIFQLTLQVVLFNMVGQGSRDLPEVELLVIC